MRKLGLDHLDARSTAVQRTLQLFMQIVTRTAAATLPDAESFTARLAEAMSGWEKRIERGY
jgi:hypothetical protein